MHSVLGAGLGYAFGDLNVDELEVLPPFDFVPGAKQIDNHVGILQHAFDLSLVLVVHAVVQPRAV